MNCYLYTIASFYRIFLFFKLALFIFYTYRTQNIQTYFRFILNFSFSCYDDADKKSSPPNFFPLFIFFCFLNYETFRKSCYVHKNLGIGVEIVCELFSLKLIGYFVIVFSLLLFRIVFMNIEYINNDGNKKKKTYKMSVFEIYFMYTPLQ